MFRFILLDFASIFDEAPSITTFLSKTNNRFKVFVFLIALLDDRAELLMSSCLLNLSTSYIIITERNCDLIYRTDKCYIQLSFTSKCIACKHFIS